MLLSVEFPTLGGISVSQTHLVLHWIKIFSVLFHYTSPTFDALDEMQELAFLLKIFN
jgi:hypothetical protein